MKSYVISVSLGTGCYRHIQIGGSATLYKLHKAIIQAFDFDDDHAHAFFMDDRYWGHGDTYFSMKMRGNERLTKNARLEQFRFEKGAKFKYLFDYGDEWRFQCKVLREVEERTDVPRILRSVGESPEQYPATDDEWDNELWEFVGDEEDADGEWDEEEDADGEWDEEEDADGEWDEEEDGDESDEWPEEEFSQEEIEAMYAAIPLKRKVINGIQQYFDAACRLYGLIRLDKLYEIYNSQNLPVSRENFFLVAVVSAQEEHQYVIIPCGEFSETDFAGNLSSLEVAAEYLFYDDDTRDYDRLRQGINEAEFKILPKGEFLRYGDPYGHPVTPQNTALLKFLQRKEDELARSAKDMCHAIQNYLMMDATLATILQELQHLGLVVDSKSEMPEFSQIIKELERSTPKHIHRGYTPDEMFSMSKKGRALAERNAPENQISLFDEPERKPQLTLVGGPARNAPCPCGSGRKYKNCCGKR